MLTGMKPSEKITRRNFLAKSAATAAAVAVPPSIGAAQARETIRVGLIGCGGRGTGAMVDCFNADPGVVAWAMGDAFADRMKSSQDHLKDHLKDRFQVTPARTFVGLDAYRHVIASDVDLVILAAPPGFRPAHFKAAVEAGKHVFMEKPVATDAPGVRSMFESAALAESKRLCVVTGTQRHHDLAYRETIRRIHDGQMGDITACYAYWNQGGLWMLPRQPEWTDLEWQLRNWLYFTWLSGDIIVEQHIHNIDVCNWAMRKHPVKAISLAGREVRKDPAYGHVFDHFATEFEYDNGVKMISMCRQIDGTSGRVMEWIVGTKGVSDANSFIRTTDTWKFEGERPNPYVLEHKDLIAAIRSGTPVNEAKRVTESTLTAMMGRMAGYTGLQVTWEQALNSKESLVPEKCEFGPMTVPQVAIPGQTKLI